MSVTMTLLVSSWCCFNLHFQNDWWCICLGEISFQIFDTCFTGLFILLLSYESSLYIMNEILLPDRVIPGYVVKAASGIDTLQISQSTDAIFCMRNDGVCT